MDEHFVRQRITELRLQKGVSEYQMSYDLGQNKNYVRAITSGQALPSLRGLFNICDYFNITPAEFFAHDEYPQLIRAAIQQMTQLDEDDMLLVLSLLQRFIKNKGTF